jgi:DnaJ-class molecular chaperone
MSDSYAQQAEAEIWDEIVANEAPPEPANETCDGCNGSGIYYGRGYVENGVFKGFKGTCYRCGGKGTQTAKDVKRNTYYDNHVRRIYP